MQQGSLAVPGLTGALLVLTVTVAAQTTWRTMPSPLPDARDRLVAMAHDSDRRVVVLVATDVAAQDLVTRTWEWVGTRWREAADLAPGRSGAALAYDPVRRETVLFGGRDQRGEAKAETWVWNGATWTQRAPATSPPATAHPVMCFHAATSCVVLCASAPAGGGAFSTFTWDGTDWLRQTPKTAPPVGEVHAMAYDAGRAVAVIVEAEAGSDALSTWEWDGTDWTRCAAANVPGLRVDHGLAYDTSRKRTVLFGGRIPATGTGLADTWEWDGTDWRRLALERSPPARHGHAMADDGERHAVLMLGGRTSGEGNSSADVWQLISLPDDEGEVAIGLGGGAGGKFGGRAGGRAKLGGRGGRLTAQAIENGLNWLAAHQDGDGRWDADEFMKHDAPGAPCTGPGEPLHDVGVTGLVLLAFLGDGSTMKSGPYKEAIKKAVVWLRAQQDDATGLIGTPASHQFIYDHAIATLALCEAYGLSKYRSLKSTAQKAINYLEAHRNPFGCWRYQQRAGDNDMSVTGWAVLAYLSAKDFGLLIDAKALANADTFITDLTDAQGRTGYLEKGGRSSRRAGQHAVDFPADNVECMTAVGLLCKYFLGHDPKATPMMQDQAKVVAAKLPQWRKDPKGSFIDHYYWYFGTHAMYQVGGLAWVKWSKALTDAVIKHQRTDGSFKGSWDPDDAWGQVGGRVYSTAILVLTLEAYYRYARVVGGR